MNSFIEALRQRLQDELPGEESHSRMLPKNRREGKHTSFPKKAGVLILLFPEEKDIKTVVIKRAIDNSPHSGQIALPGGRHENQDIDITHTALRESWEEIGILPEEVNVLGALTHIYIPVSNYEVVPVLGFIKEKPAFILNKNEVEEIIEISISELTGKEVYQNTCLKKEDHKEVWVPCLQIKKSPPIWGATAMILSELIDLINDLPATRWL